MRVSIKTKGSEDNLEAPQPWDFATLGLHDKIIVEATYDSANLIADQTAIREYEKASTRGSLWTCICLTWAIRGLTLFSLLISTFALFWLDVLPPRG